MFKRRGGEEGVRRRKRRMKKERGVKTTFCQEISCAFPTSKGAMHNGSSVGIYTCAYGFCMFGTKS